MTFALPAATPQLISSRPFLYLEPLQGIDRTDILIILNPRLTSIRGYFWQSYPLAWMDKLTDYAGYSMINDDPN